MSLQNGGIDLSGLIDTKGLEEKLDPAIAKMDEIINKLDKLSNSKGKVSLQIDKKDIKNLDALQTSLDKLGTTKSANQKIKYFQSTENAIDSVKKAWNNYVTAIKNGNIGEDKMFSDSKATAVLRYANAFEALKGDIKSISPEIAEFVQKMRSIDTFTDKKGYNFTVSGFTEAFEELSKLKDLGVSFKGFEPVKEQTVELLSLLKETGSSVQNLGLQVNTSLGNGSMQGAIDEQQEYQDELMQTQEKIKAVALTEKELEQRLSHGKKKPYNGTEEDLFYDLNINDNLSDIEKYSQALEKLNQKKKEALSDATMWQNSMAYDKNKEDISNATKDQRWMRNSLQEYQEYSAQVEFIQERLQEAIRNYTPNADGKDGEAIKVLILLLQNLNEEINKIRTSFGTIDDESGLKSLLSSIQEINQYLSVTSSEIRNLTATISGININVNLGNANNPIARNMQYGSSARDLIGQLKAQKSELETELSKIFGGDGIQSTFKLFQGTSVLGNSGKDFFDIVNNINDSSTSLTQQMNSLKDYINLIKEAANLKGIDLSSVFDKYNTNIDKAVESTQKILTGENEVEDSAKSLFNLLGQGNQVNLDGIIEQLNVVILKLEDITKLVSSGLNINKALDVGDNAQEVEAETISIGSLEQVVDNITEAVKRKNEAFKEEANIVAVSTDQEIAELGNLLNWLQTIEKQLNDINDVPINIDINKNITENTGKSNSKNSDTKTTSTSSSGTKAIAKDAKEAKKEVEETVIEIKQGTAEWNHIAQAVKNYKNILGESYNIIQKIRDANTDKPKISYQVTGETGNSITLGHDTKLISSTNKVSDSLSQKKLDNQKQVLALLDEEAKKEDIINTLKQQGRQQEEEIVKKNQEYIAYWEERLALEEKEQAIQNSIQQKRDKETYDSAYNNLDKQANSLNNILKIKEKITNESNDVKVQKLNVDLKDEQKRYEQLVKEGQLYSDIISKEEKRRILTEKTASALEKLHITQNAKNNITDLSNSSTKSKIKEISEVEKAFKTLTSTEERYQKLLGKQDANKNFTNDELISLKSITEQREKANQILNQTTVYTEQEMNAQKKYNEEIAKQASLRSTTFDTYNNSNLDKINALLTETTNKMERLRTVNSSEIYTQAFQSAEEKVAKLNNDLKNDLDFKDYSAKIKDITTNLSKMQNVIAKIEPQNLQAAKEAMNEYARVISNGKAEWISGNDDKGTSVYKWKDQNDIIQKLSMSYDEYTGNLKANTVAQKQNEKATVSMTERIKSHAKNLASYLATFVSFYKIWDILKQGISTIKDLDSALTEMRKVSNETVSSLKNFQKASFDIADSVGTTAVQVQESTADFLRLGQSFDKAKESAKAANVLFNVSEFGDIEDATNALISAQQAYQELDTTSIIDKLNNVGNNFAIGTDGLATALQKSAAVLKQSGNDIDEALALITAGNSILQDPDSVGAALRVIPLRIDGTEQAKEELKSLGEDVDDFVVQTKSKIDEQVKNYTAVASNNFKGISLLDDNGNYKGTFEYLLEISKIYKEIQETDKQFGTNRSQGLIELLAGKNRSNVLASILSDPNLLENIYETSQHSEGSAQEELEKQLQSIEGKLQKFQNSVQKFWYDFISSDAIKNIVDAGTTLINILDTTIGKLDSIKTLVIGIAGILEIKQATKGGGRGKIKMFPLKEYKICLRAS